MHSAAIASAIGFFPWYTDASPAGSGKASLSTAVNASTAWVRASMPLSAVTFGGQPTVSSGSTTANAGRRNGLRHDTFMCRSVSVKTAAADTSDPVPAVVGTADQRARSARGRGSRRCSRAASPPWARTSAHSFATSMLLPPPRPTTTSGRAARAAATHSRTTSRRRLRPCRR